MQKASRERVATVALTFVAAALAAGSAVWWVLKWSAPATTESAFGTPQVPAPTGRPPDVQAVARLLGGNPDVRTRVATVGDTTAARLKLLGVVAAHSRVSRSSVALIAVDGKPARPYRIGSAVVDSWILTSVTARSAELQQTDPTNPAGVRADRTGPADARPNTGQQGAVITLEMPRSEAATPAAPQTPSR